MAGFKRGAAFGRPGILASVAGLAIIWAASTGATQQPEQVDAQMTASSDVSQPAPQPVVVSGRWRADTARELIASIEAARAEGLDPRAYDVAAVRRAAEAGPGAALDQAADAAAMRLARDYYFGRVVDRDDMGWMIQRPADEPARLAAGLQQAIASGGLRDFYASLLPGDARYAALRDALAEATDPALRDRLRVNMERWRWMPRALGQDYLYVNVPSYQLQVIDAGTSIARYDVVVGAKATPTPMLASPTGSLVVNPWWNVPQSIVKSSNLRPGRGNFIFKASGDGSYQVRQPPGPRNALGKIKFNLANDQAIYLHDTNAKSAFGRDQRALSHGCIRVKDIDQLAAQLIGDDGGDTARLDDALARDDTATLRLPRTWQVYIVYFTIDGDRADSLTRYSDPYGYDATILARLDGGSTPGARSIEARGIQVAAR